MGNRDQIAIGLERGIDQRKMSSLLAGRQGRRRRECTGGNLKNELTDVK